MYKEKIFKFDNIDLYLTEDKNLLFMTVAGKECVFDPIKNIFLYDDTDEYNKIFIDCFIEDNQDILDNWSILKETGDYQFRDTR